MQLFQNRCLLIVSDEHGNMKVYLDEIDILDNAIKADRTKASFSYTKLGSDVRIAVDETRALLVLVSSDGTVRELIYDYIESLSFKYFSGYLSLTYLSLHGELFFVGSARNSYDSPFVA